MIHNRMAWVGLFCLVTGCATLFGNHDRTITVQSQPAGAQVFLNGTPMGVTPTTVMLDNSDMLGSNMITLRKPGYYEVSANVRKEFQVISLLNFGGLIGWVVDIFTGNVFRLKDKYIDQQLQKQ